MRVLVVTGELAKEKVKRYVEESPISVEVLALPKPVAALLSPEMIKRELKDRGMKGYSMILVPGLVRGDISIVEDAVGIPAFKGPKYAADIPLVLGLIDHLNLSKVRAADELLEEYQRQRALRDLEIGVERRRLLLKRPGSMVVYGLELGKGFPVRVMAEILDAPALSDDEILEKALYYTNSGADMICVGMTSGESNPKDAYRAVRTVKESCDLPVSIDTFNIKEAEAGIRAGADMLLSVDEGNIREVVELASEIPIVVTPTKHCGAYLPRRASERVELMEENIRKAFSLGAKKVIGDLILNPINAPGLVESIVAFYKFTARNPEIPLLIGSENVTELTDADSVGMNALLAGVASELDVSIILTTEGSWKTMGSVRELATASKMMFLAKRRCSPPKDLGISLLILKDKRERGLFYDKKLERDALIIEAKGSKSIEMDQKGFFRILIDRKEGKLAAVYNHIGGSKVIVKGKRAQDVCSTIIDVGLISTLTHAAYLGRELEKAETALKTGKNYIQDEPLFPSLRMEEWK